jgi:hypothetical protein
MGYSPNQTSVVIDKQLHYVLKSRSLDTGRTIVELVNTLIATQLQAEMGEELFQLVYARAEKLRPSQVA